MATFRVELVVTVIQEEEDTVGSAIDTVITELNEDTENRFIVVAVSAEAIVA